MTMDNSSILIRRHLYRQCKLRAVDKGGEAMVGGKLQSQRYDLS